LIGSEATHSRTDFVDLITLTLSLYSTDTITEYHLARQYFNKLRRSLTTAHFLCEHDLAVANKSTLRNKSKKIIHNYCNVSFAKVHFVKSIIFIQLIAWLAAINVRAL